MRALRRDGTVHDQSEERAACSKKSMVAALGAERADDVPTVAWLTDGAARAFTVATELGPLGIQLRDLPQAVHWAMECGKALLGEGDGPRPKLRCRADGQVVERHRQDPQPMPCAVSDPHRRGAAARWLAWSARVNGAFENLRD